MQNVTQESSPDNPKLDKVNVHHEIPSTPHSTSNSSPAKSETETYSEHRRYMSDSSESEEDSVSEVGFCFVPNSPRGPSINELKCRETSCGSRDCVRYSPFVGFVPRTPYEALHKPGGDSHSPLLYLRHKWHGTTCAITTFLIIYMLNWPVS